MIGPGLCDANMSEQNGETRCPKPVRRMGLCLIAGVPGCVEDPDGVVDEQHCSLFRSFLGWEVLADTFRCCGAILMSNMSNGCDTEISDARSGRGGLQVPLVLVPSLGRSDLWVYGEL